MQVTYLFYLVFAYFFSYYLWISHESPAYFIFYMQYFQQKFKLHILFSNEH